MKYRLLNAYNCTQQNNPSSSYCNIIFSYFKYRCDNMRDEMTIKKTLQFIELKFKNNKKNAVGIYNLILLIALTLDTFMSKKQYCCIILH